MLFVHQKSSKHTNFPKTKKKNQNFCLFNKTMYVRHPCHKKVIHVYLDVSNLYGLAMGKQDLEV